MRQINLYVFYRYYDRVKEERRPPSEFPTVDTEDDEDDLPITERERNLEGLTSAFDLALFREAQAQASEVRMESCSPT